MFGLRFRLSGNRSGVMGAAAAHNSGEVCCCCPRFVDGAI